MSRIKLDPSLEKLFSVSDHGFRLENRHFYAVYKTRLLKYDGREVGERGQGNIVSFTRLYPARDEEFAISKAPLYFDVSNPTFGRLDRTKIEEVKHTLVEVKEFVPPTLSEEKFRVFNRQEYSRNHFFMRVRIFPNRGEPLPESFHGFEHCLIRRIQRHIWSKHATAYLYHPWHGAGDNYTEWHRCDKGTGNYSMLEREFNKRETDEAKKFAVTEYTDLDDDEQELIRRLKRLQVLDNQLCELCSEDYFLHKDLMQGRFYKEFGDIVFSPDENNYLRRAFLGRDEKVSEARIKIQDLEYRRKTIDREIESLKKFIEEEKKEIEK